MSIEQKSKKSGKDGSSDQAGSEGKSDYNRLMCYFDMASISDAATAMALLSGSCSDDLATGLKLSFVATTIEEQKKRIKKDTKSNLVIIESDKKAGEGGNGAA